MSKKAAKNNETIIFLHIPKTAGTTLDQIIFRHYSFKKVYQTGSTAQRGVRDYVNLSPVKQANYRILKGHLNFGIHKYVPNLWSYFTFLREPVDRTISHFYFIAQNEEHPLYKQIKAQKMGIKEYLEAGLDPMLFNAHTRLLSGVWDKNPAGTCTLDHLKMAKENLKAHIRVIGLTERFDESLLLLKRAFGWRHIYYAPQNVTRNRPTKDGLDQDSLKAIENANELDLELYEYALPLFQEQIEQYGPDFTEDICRFRFRNRILGPIGGLYWNIRKISVRAFIQEKLARFEG